MKVNETNLSISSLPVHYHKTSSNSILGAYCYNT